MARDEPAPEAATQGTTDVQPARSKVIYRITLAITILTVLVVIAISTLLIISVQTSRIPPTARRPTRSPIAAPRRSRRG